MLKLIVTWGPGAKACIIIISVLLPEFLLHNSFKSEETLNKSFKTKQNNVNIQMKLYNYLTTVYAMFVQTEYTGVQGRGFRSVFKSIARHCGQLYESWYFEDTVTGFFTCLSYEWLWKPRGTIYLFYNREWHKYSIIHRKQQSFYINCIH